MNTPLKLLLSALWLSLMPISSHAEQALEALDKEFLEFLSIYIDADAETIDQVFDTETTGDHYVEESSSDESK